MMLSVQFHSLTDLITNSSTVIYTYSSESPQACREMIDEIFKVLGVNKKCDDVFQLTVLAAYEYTYESYLDEESEDETEDIDITKLMEDIKFGRIEKPQWMEKAEDRESSYGYSDSTTLHIVAKEPEFERLAKLVVDFLYSTGHEATRDG